MTTSACGGSACIADVSRDCGHGIFRLEGGATRSQSKRATNCANPGFLGIQFCFNCGQTCGHGDFLTTSPCGGSACIAGTSRDCEDGVFRLEGGAPRTQSRRATNCATPGYSVYLSGWSYAPKPGAIPTSLYPDIHFSAMIPRQAVKIKIFLSVVIPVVKAAFVPLSAARGNPANAGAARLCGVSP